MASRPGVLLTGARAPVALDLARRFHADGWRVHVADSLPAHSTGGSRAVAGRHRVASPRAAPAGFIADLVRIARAQAIDLLVPTCEEVFYIAHGRAGLPGALQVATSSFDTLRALHSKWAFLGLAQGLGAGVPASARVRTLEQARAWAGGRPVVLKPEFSRFGTEVQLLPQGIGDAQAPLDGQRDWVVQALLAGRECCSYAVAANGRLLAHAAYAPKHRLARSSSYYFAPVQEPAITAFTAALVARLGYTGQIAFDWIIDQAGTPWVLECNPRATSGAHLFAPGDRLPAALAGQDMPCFGPGHDRAAMLAALMWADALPRALARGRLAAWRADMAGADDVLMVPGDRRPGPATLQDLAAFAVGAVRGRCSLRAAATADCEWDGQALAPP